VVGLVFGVILPGAPALRSPQILKEFENLKFFNLGPSSDLMDENWTVTLKFKIQILNPSDQNFKIQILNLSNQTYQYP
jgi:hypothetical protein